MFISRENRPSASTYVGAREISNGILSRAKIMTQPQLMNNFVKMKQTKKKKEKNTKINNKYIEKIIKYYFAVALATRVPLFGYAPWCILWNSNVCMRIFVSQLSCMLYCFIDHLFDSICQEECILDGAWYKVRLRRRLYNESEFTKGISVRQIPFVLRWLRFFVLFCFFFLNSHSTELVRLLFMIGRYEAWTYSIAVSKWFSLLPNRILIGHWNLGSSEVVLIQSTRWLWFYSKTYF